MKRDAINKMLSDLVNEVDYDLWKVMFLEGHSEDPEETEKTLKRMRNIVRKHLPKPGDEPVPAEES